MFTTITIIFKLLTLSFYFLKLTHPSSLFMRMLTSFIFLFPNTPNRAVMKSYLKFKYRYYLFYIVPCFIKTLTAFINLRFIISMRLANFKLLYIFTPKYL